MENNKNRVKVDIAGTRFTVVSGESEEYTRSVADRLNKEIDTVRKAAPGLSASSAVMLASLNLCDDLTKSEEETDRMRGQIKSYLSESAKYRTAYEELARENEKLKKDIETLRKRLGDKAKVINDPSPISPSVKAVRRSSASEAADEGAENVTFFGSRKKRP